MITPKKLKVRGFRGFMSQREFNFDAPIVFLFGENHCGKSITLNAIEWCLFGDECMGRQTSIRERVNWEEANRNMDSTDVFVELEIEGLDGLYIIRRSLKPRIRGIGLQKMLELNVPNGTLLVQEQASERLAQLLHSSFKDFMTTVYQHQETIRSILTQEPRERNDAIDRLLGLSDYRNLLNGLNAAKLATKQKQIAIQFDAFVEEVKAALHTRENDLRGKREDAKQEGIAEADLNEQGALRITQEVLNSLDNFAFESGISHPSLQIPGDWKGLREFQQLIHREIGRMRTEMPDTKEQVDLFRLQSKLDTTKSDYKDRDQEYKKAHERLQAFERENGDEKTINSKTAHNREDVQYEETKLRETNVRAELVAKAIIYLKQIDIEKLENRCPICRSEATDLLECLQEEWNQEIEIQVREIQENIERLKAEAIV